MYADLKKVKQFQFPFYRIQSDNWDIIDGVVFVDGQPVDDLNRSGSSIGIRRKQSGRTDFYKLRNPLFLIGDVLRDKGRHYISSDGIPFTYEKTKFQKLKYHEIDKFDPRDTFSFVWLRGIEIPFEIARPPLDSGAIPWARVLYYGDFPWMIFEYSKFRGRDSRMKV